MTALQFVYQYKAFMRDKLIVCVSVFTVYIIADHRLFSTTCLSRSKKLIEKSILNARVE